VSAFDPEYEAARSTPKSREDRSNFTLENAMNRVAQNASMFLRCPKIKKCTPKATNCDQWLDSFLSDETWVNQTPIAHGSRRPKVCCCSQQHKEIRASQQPGVALEQKHSKPVHNVDRGNTTNIKISKRLDRNRIT
jgi:hypothetical protein